MQLPRSSPACTRRLRSSLQLMKKPQTATLPVHRMPTLDLSGTTTPSTAAPSTAAREQLIEIVPAEIEIEVDELVEQLLEQTSEDNSVQSVMMSEKLLEMALTRLKQMEGEVNK